MVLPTISLALISYAAWSRFQRASMLEVLNSDYVRLARAKGLRSRRVLIRHALRTALIPLTTVTALDIGGIFGGAVITETVFQLAGHGHAARWTPSATATSTSLLAWLLVAGIVVIVVQPDRRPALRRARPEDPLCLSTDRRPAGHQGSRRAAARTPTASSPSRSAASSSWCCAASCGTGSPSSASSCSCCWSLFAFVGPQLWKYDYAVHRRPSSRAAVAGAPVRHRPAPATTCSARCMRGTQQSLKIALLVALIADRLRHAVGRDRRLLPRLDRQRC